MCAESYNVPGALRVARNMATSCVERRLGAGLLEPHVIPLRHSLTANNSMQNPRHSHTVTMSSNPRTIMNKGESKECMTWWS